MFMAGLSLMVMVFITVPLAILGIAIMWAISPTLGMISIGVLGMGIYAVVKGEVNKP